MKFSPLSLCNSPCRSMQNWISLFFFSNNNKQYCFHKSASVLLQLFESLMRTFKQGRNVSHCRLETDGRYETIFSIRLKSGRKAYQTGYRLNVYVKYHVISNAPKFKNNEEKIMRTEKNRNVGDCFRPFCHYSLEPSTFNKGKGYSFFWYRRIPRILEFTFASK